MTDSAAKPTVVLHVGAHRTGTTTIQAALDNARPALAASGIVALTPPRVGKRDIVSIRKLVNLAGSTRRPAGMLLLPAKRRKASALWSELLSAETDTPERIIVSDEKMLGGIFNRRGTSIYPAAASHLAAVRRMLPVEVGEIHLTVRAYDRFIPSSYAMRVVFGRDIPRFETIADNLTRVEKTWTDLLDDVANSFASAKITVSVFEETGFEDRLKALLGESAKHMNIADNLPAAMNQSPTVEAIEHVYRHGKPDDPDALVARYADGTPFEPLNEAVRQSLRARYDDEISLLKKRRDLHFL